MTFVIVAGVSVAVAAVTHKLTEPKPLEGFEKVGQEFYPDFTNANDAKALRVVAYDEDTAAVSEFSVEFKDGVWRIPSRHNYPADAEDRLSKTAASVIGITRGAMISRRESDFEKYGVIDPDDKGTTLKGRGQRITLTKQDGSVLADYIIGKKAEGEENRYNVRHPKEKETYVAELKINLSTKFADWIESDLLKMERDEMSEIVINKYSIDEDQLRIVDREVNKLTRKSFSDPWKLEGLNEEAEELKADEVSRLVSNLDDLKIVGVRPKPQGLNPDLSLDPKVSRQPLLVSVLRNDLASKGFLIAQDQEGNPHLVSNEGEVTASTNKGVSYNLYFGEIFTGDEMDIEIGKPNDEAKPADADKAATADAEKTKETESDEKPAGEGEKSPDDKNLKKSRYLFVSVKFDDSLLEKPQEPVKPEPPAESPKATEEKKDNQKPAEQKPAEEKKPAAAAEKDGQDQPKGSDSKNASPPEDDELDEPDAAVKETDSKPANPAVETEKKAPVATAPENEGAEKQASDGKKESEPKSADDQPDAKKETGEQKDPQATYDEALKKYNADLDKYQLDLKEHERKLEEGKKKVDELNRRFAGWYYVISAESFENLRLSRADLVKPKEKPAEETKPADPGAESEKKPDGEKEAAADKKPSAEAKPEPAAPAKPESEAKPQPEKQPSPDSGSKPNEATPAKNDAPQKEPDE
jgi:hypothetical protein